MTETVLRRAEQKDRKDGAPGGHAAQKTRLKLSSTRILSHERHTNHMSLSHVTSRFHPK